MKLKLFNKDDILTQLYLNVIYQRICNFIKQLNLYKLVKNTSLKSTMINITINLLF